MRGGAVPKGIGPDSKIQHASSFAEHIHGRWGFVEPRKVNRGVMRFC